MNLRFGAILFLAFSTLLRAEVDGDDGYSAVEPDQSTYEAQQPAPKKKKAASKKNKYMIEDTSRTDAGVFHVGFAAGGNFYMEPQVSNHVPTGYYYRDPGFQAGAYFDYDYSEMTSNIPLMLRGMIGYKYILNSVHVFTVEGMVRHMIALSSNVNMGLGLGGNAAVWYRVPSNVTPTADEEVVFMPSLALGVGFEFNPFMVDFKWLINRIGADNTISGVELSFGFRL